MVPFKGTKIVTYHRSWPNFTPRFGLDVVGEIKPLLALRGMFRDQHPLLRLMRFVRPLLRGKVVRKLAERHARNGKALVG